MSPPPPPASLPPSAAGRRRRLAVVLALGLLPGKAAWAQADASPTTVSNDVLTVVAFGASATANHDDPDLVYPRRLADRLNGRGIPAEVINAGVADDTTTRARARFTWDVMAHVPDLVLLQFGVHDAAIETRDGESSPNVPLSEFVTNLEALLDSLAENQIAAVLMTPPPLLWSEAALERYGRAPYDVNDRLGRNLLSEAYVRAVRSLAAARSIPLVDVFADFAAHDAEEDGQLEDLLHDGGHPNDRGHARIAELLEGVIADLVAERRLTLRPRREPDLPAGAAVVFVEAGQPVGVHDPFGAWETRDGMLWGTERELLADHGLLDGDFHLSAEIAIAKLDATAAAFGLGRSYFGFDGKGNSLYASGPLFDDRIARLGPAAEVFVPGVPVLFEVQRIGDQLRFLIDGRLIHARGHAGPLDRIGFAPLRAELGVRDFRVRGRTRPRPAPLPIGYDLPIVDLAGETDRQVVVDRDEDVYLGHPTTVLLDDDRTIIAVYPEGHGRGPIRMVRSPDGGLTWTDPLSVPDNWASSQETPTIHKVTTPTGGRRLLLFSGLYPIRVAISDDEGLSWSPLRAIGDFGGIVAMSSVEQIDQDTILALFHDDGRYLRNSGRWKAMSVYKTISSDGGETWSQPTLIAHRPDVHLCEPGLVRSPDGTRLAVLLRENSRSRNSYVTFGDARGNDWTEPRELPAALTGDRHVARYTEDGRLLITFRDTTLISATRGDWVAWVGTWDDLERGTEGSYRVRLMDNLVAADCAYPGLELLPDGTFVATTYGHWVEGAKPFIVAVRFTMAELDERLATMLAEPFETDGDER